MSVIPTVAQFEAIQEAQAEGQPFARLVIVETPSGIQLVPESIFQKE